MCILYTLHFVPFDFVAFSLSISFALMILVLVQQQVAFAYCFHVKWYYVISICVTILYSYYSYSKFEVLTILILNDTHEVVVDFNSPRLNIYRNHKISMIRMRTLQYLVKGCVSFLPAVCVNTTTTKTVNFDEWFESPESFMSTISMSKGVWMFRMLWVWC